MFRKLSNFLKTYFQDPLVINKNQEEYTDEFPDIFFPFPMKLPDENSYNQMTLVLGLKLAAIKLHDFTVQSIDEFLKIYEKILGFCNNPDLLMIILDVSEALIMK